MIIIRPWNALFRELWFTDDCGSDVCQTVFSWIHCHIHKHAVLTTCLSPPDATVWMSLTCGLMVWSLCSISRIQTMADGLSGFLFAYMHTHYEVSLIRTGAVSVTRTVGYTLEKTAAVDICYNYSIIKCWKMKYWLKTRKVHLLWLFGFILTKTSSFSLSLSLFSNQRCVIVEQLN